ncbi:MAG: transposase [Myxococcota bacterium]
MAKIRKYTKQFKQDAVRLALRGDKSVDQSAKDLGMPSSTLHGWIAQTRAPQKNNAHSPDLTTQLLALKKEHARVKEERDILKKAAAYFARHQR